MNGNADLWPSVLLTAGTAGEGAGPHCCWEAALLEERILRRVVLMLVTKWHKFHNKVRVISIVVPQHLCLLSIIDSVSKTEISAIRSWNIFF